MRPLPSTGPIAWPRLPALVAATALAALAMAARADDRAAAAEALVRGLEQPGLPGCAVGVVQGRALALSSAYGLADVEHGLRIDGQTRFDIGSMSKQFVAMEILLLAAGGKLALEDDIRRYVPELPEYPWTVTLRDLLHQTSGLKDYDQLLQLAGWAEGDLKSAGDVLWIVARQRSLGFRPGARFSYSDTNYFLLGLAAQRVTGTPLPELLRETIFAPLGMTHTSLQVDHWALVPHRAWPYRVQDGVPRLFVNGEEPLGDGGIFSTVVDLAMWERNFDEARVGGAQVVEELQRLVPLADGSANDYAAGLFIRDYRGHRLIEHSGASYGFVAEKLRFPAQHLSIIVLCNRRDAPFVGLSNRLADAYLGLAPAQEPAPTVAAGSELEPFAGLYFSEAASDGVKLEVRKGQLVDDGAGRVYRQAGPLVFESAPAGICRCTSTLTFSHAASGAITGFSEATPVGGGATRPRETAYQRMAPTGAVVLDDYVGEYVSDEVATSWCLRREGGSLLIRRRGFADRPAPPLWPDAALAPGGPMLFRREGGRVTGFEVANPRSHSTAFRKLPAGQHPVPAPVPCP